MTGKAVAETTGTPLRQRMIDQMRIANLAESTCITYIGEIEHLAKHYNASPADLDADHLRAWVLSGIDRGLSPATTNVTVAALKFFYCDTLRCPERVAGLRISETVAIKTGDIKSDKKLLHIPSGKGGTERMAPLPHGVIDYLRGYWKNMWPQPAIWLFYGASPDVPIRTGTLNQAFKKARDKAGIDSRFSFHCLRHSTATHLHERGANMEVIRDALGHRRADTTREYARATAKMFEGLDHPVSGFPVLRR